jgi:ribosomal protein S18 acetylase RimI-like enzyme
MRQADVEPLALALGWPAYGIDRRWQETVAGFREMFVADREGTPVGSVSINEKADYPALLHLFALDVAPAYQRRGIGSRLIAAVESEGRARDKTGVFLEVSVENTGAIRLYERLGYGVEGSPFLNSWNQYDAEGNVAEEVVETVQRMFKRFG